MCNIVQDVVCQRHLKELYLTKWAFVGLALALNKKMHINWLDRKKKLEEILDRFRESSGDNYDCLVPISGGKDSVFQLHMLVKIYKMKPLAVTFNHNWYTETGQYNLWNILEKLNVDHIMFTPNRGLINNIAKQSLHMIGDSCWHCHAGVGSLSHFRQQLDLKFLLLSGVSQLLKPAIKQLIWIMEGSQYHLMKNIILKSHQKSGLRK